MQLVWLPMQNIILLFVLHVRMLCCFIVFGCQYQCNRLPGKTRFQNGLFGCAECKVNRGGDSDMR